MNPELSKVLDQMYQANRARDLARFKTFFEPHVVLKTPLLSEPLKGWSQIEAHIMEMLMPLLKDLEILTTQELGNQVLRGFRTRVTDREGVDRTLEGSVLYTFSPNLKVSEVMLFFDEANVRLLVLKRI